MDNLDKEQNKERVLTPANNGPSCSPRVENIINNKIRRLEAKRNALVLLKDSIPWEILSATQEQQLWEYFCNN